MGGQSAILTEGNVLFDYFYRQRRDQRHAGTPSLETAVVDRGRPSALEIAVGDRRRLPSLAVLRQRCLDEEMEFERRRHDFQHAAEGTPLLLNADGSRVVIGGLCVPWNFPRQGRDGGWYQFRRGSVSSVSEYDYRVRRGDHEGPFVANFSSGMLRVWVGADGLRFACLLPAGPDGWVAAKSAREATGVSISYKIVDARHDGRCREILKAHLAHIAILEAPAMPAFRSTWVKVRSERFDSDAALAQVRGLEIR